ncbi:unnamed protein product [Owenia fusiformis]|uniref:Uncharacterized protein n=1 Tax=Owenia fusiformis TaxID=6347 RepID=A0A8J1TE75_OWEFU|nr:unnamed protein product [Owenia fusiformis]
MADEIETESASFLSTFASELFGSPLNLCLLAICLFLLYKIFAGRRNATQFEPRPPALAKLKKQDFTLEQLREYDGKAKDGRILMSVNGKVFDVTRGKRFYGPGGPYGVFAGRDASRGLATFSLNEQTIQDEYDDLSDLNSTQMESVREWEEQFMEKYDYVGKLLRPGESPTDYSDNEEDSSKDGEKSKDD